MFGKIIAIVDTFDMMTSPTPARYAYTPFNTLQIMINEKGYDKELLEIFIKILGKLI